MLTREIMRKFAPKCTDPEAWADALNRGAKLVGITTPREWAHYMAQLSVECKAFTDFEEDLWYSAERLMVVWPKRFPTMASARLVAENPKALANLVYNGRMSNRVGTDDGWYFRGRGPKQITGRANYTAFEEWLEVQDMPMPIRTQPELLTTPKVGGLSSAWFWKTNKLSAVLQQNSNDAAALKSVTRIVNGGLNGLPERLSAYKRFVAVV